MGHLEAGVGEIKRMYVDPAARGHQIGRQLLGRAEELAVQRGCRSLRSKTGTAQPEALRLYDSAGWSRVGCTDHSRDDPTTVCFSRELGAATGGVGPEDPVGQSRRCMMCSPT